LDDARERLPQPGEPAGLRAETRALLEESPEQGARLVEDATFVAGPLWEEWGEILERGGMDQTRFLEIARGYSAELRLWVVGERPWNHCVSGLAGRVRRRLPAQDAAASRR
jgi:hypothetical protein